MGRELLWKTLASGCGRLSRSCKSRDERPQHCEIQGKTPEGDAGVVEQTKGLHFQTETVFTPYRVDLCGGFADVPELFRKAGVGYTLNLAIRQGVSIKVQGSKVEIADPYSGYGLGSSAAKIVALLKLMRDWDNSWALANTAFLIEREVLGNLCGYQDQLASAFGGLNLFEFREHGIERYALDYALPKLSVVLFGRSRRSKPILAHAIKTLAKRDVVELNDSTLALVEALRTQDFEMTISAINRGREVLTRIEGWVSKPMLDYVKVWSPPAWKPLGAGGNSLLVVEPNHRAPKTFDCEMFSW